MSQVKGVMQMMGISWREVLLWGTVSVHYGLVNDRICPRAAWEGVRLTVLPGGCSSNLVILSSQSRCTLMTEFTDKVANFHPYCPVTLSEKWTISSAGMRWCFGDACSDSFSGYITCRYWLACLWLCTRASVLTFCHRDQVHGFTRVWSFLSCIGGKQANLTLTKWSPIANKKCQV